MNKYIVNEVTNRKILSLIGNVYGRLTVKSFDIDRFKKDYKKGVSTKKYWICNCECGKENISIYETSLKKGISKSCGCLRDEMRPKLQVIDIVGNKYGRLLVLERVKNKWKCLCDCGNISYVKTDVLKSGKTQSCGCYKYERISQTQYIDRTGTRIGRLLLKHSIRKNDKIYWVCDCDCGNQNIEVPAGSFSAKKPTKSCGCILKEKRKFINFQDLTGKRFSKLTVIGRDTKKEESHKGFYWICKCECGSTKSVLTNDLNSGKVKSCGCIKSIGEYYAKKYFSENNIKYEYEKKFDNLLGTKGGQLSYDFYIPKYNLLIEFQGEQHEKPFRYKGVPNYDKFKIQQEHDKRKRDFARKNGFNFVEIWYKDYDKTELILESVFQERDKAMII